MTGGAGLETVASALLTLSLVVVAVAASRYQRLDLEKDIAGSPW